MSRNHPVKVSDIYRAHSGALLQNINILTNATWLPGRSREVSYTILEDDGKRIYKIHVKGKYRSMGCVIPNSYDKNVIREFMSVMREDKNGRFVARFSSGQKLYDLLGLNEFNRKEAKRVWECLRNWKHVVILFDGSYQVEGKKAGPVSQAFGVVDFIQKKNKGGKWRFKVRFNKEYIEDILVGLNTRIHLPTSVSLSPFSSKLYDYVTGALAFQEDNKNKRPLRIPMLMKKLGLKNSKTLRFEQQRIDRVRDGLDEINAKSPAFWWKYGVEVKMVRGGERRLVFEKWKLSPDDDED